MKKNAILLICLCIGSSALLAQPVQKNSAQLLRDIEKLNVLGNVLYWAAHPDDENTRLIAYFSNDILVNTGYLAATRGDGGQNLIGPELREGLGVIRTQELLAARRVDGGKQFFTRANDFGYSKTADETLKIWDKDQVLSDMVWVIRSFRPDVIITRFPPDARGGHGHHTSSAILAEEAFKLAGDKNAYPEQLVFVSVWQPTRLMINSGRWWDKDIENQPNTIKIDVGRYNAALGISYNEMAATSRSQHQSQGFGATHVRGSQFEYLKPVLGSPTASDLFEGIDLTWGRVGAAEISKEVKQLISQFNPAKPDQSVTALLQLRIKVEHIKDDFWKAKKINEIDQLIFQCAGLYLDATATKSIAIPGDSLHINIEMINRSNLPISIKTVEFNNQDQNIETLTLDFNSTQNLEIKTIVRNDKKFSGPYWLNEPATLGMYAVSNQQDRGRAENESAFELNLRISIDGAQLTTTIPVTYKSTDRVKGELYQPLNVVPALIATFNDPIIIFDNATPKTVGLTVTANKTTKEAIARLQLPSNWESIPSEIKLANLAEGASQKVEFEVVPKKGAEAVDNIGAIIEADGFQFDRSMQTIAYDHIPTQILLPKSETKAVSLTIAVGAKTVGYIMGAGDEVPKALEQMGVKVWMMAESDITTVNLATLDAVVLGVRAVNTQTWLKEKKDVLLNYVEKGGTIVTQYNTTRGIDWNDFAPFELTFSGSSARSRVAEENASVAITNSKSTVLSYPNIISEKDFSGWEQERGLYFPTTWATKYEAPLAMQDTGEQMQNGSLLVAPYGNGHYVYTGLSFFRELPAGVPGAFRLFANIISLSNATSSNVQKR